jgi:hypothetical protein
MSNSLSLPPFFALEAMGENAETDLINLNMFHHSDSGRLLICYTDYFCKNKPVEMVSVAISVRFTRFCHIMPGLIVYYVYMTSLSLIYICIYIYFFFVGVLSSSRW